MTENLNSSTIKKLLQEIRHSRIGVIGDFCLDTYFSIDNSKSEISIETGLPTKPVRESRFVPGGAGNVANNLLSIGIRQVELFGVLGNDLFGNHLRNLLSAAGAKVDGLVVQEKDWNTHVYIKTIEEEEEASRIDFGYFNFLHTATADQLIHGITLAVRNLDAVVINQQQSNGIHSDYFRRLLNDIIEEYSGTAFILDSRDFPADFPCAMRKLNQYEGKRVIEQLPEQKENFGGKDGGELQEPYRMAAALYDIFHHAVFLTLGENGCIVQDENGCRRVWGLQILNELDTVGAGDSFLAGIAAASACGYDHYLSAQFGNFVAGVTVQKLKQTGTASPAELMEISSDPDYRYHPELAADRRKASYYKGDEHANAGSTDIEIVTGWGDTRYSFAIFDHDGTISVLRQGWEAIMKPIMVQCILGDCYNTASIAALHRVEREVADYIDRTTGVQTLVQMKDLVELVRAGGYVAEKDVKDEFAYKHLYNEELMRMVEERISRFRRGQRNIQDYTLKGAVDFLEMLNRRGITLFLASGTDEEDVRREAEILGYSSLFTGGIFGAVGDINVEPKKAVISRILDEIGESRGGSIITFGDGPVEMRETKKAGGFSVGVASDEVRRYGLDERKRERLILAGADLVVPDFSERHLVADLLFGS